MRNLVLVNNLHINIKPMFWLYTILKDWDEPPTPDEIVIASGKKTLDGNTEAKYIKKLENTSKNIKKAFEDQRARAGVSDNRPFDFNYFVSDNAWQGPWDQEKFEQHLTEWIIACDQPFEEVEKPEFITMMNFMYCSGGALKIPKRKGIKHWVMKMGDETIEGICEMFMVWSHLGSVIVD